MTELPIGKLTAQTIQMVNVAQPKHIERKRIIFYLSTKMIIHS